MAALSQSPRLRTARQPPTARLNAKPPRRSGAGKRRGTAAAQQTAPNDAPRTDGAFLRVNNKNQNEKSIRGCCDRVQHHHAHTRSARLTLFSRFRVANLMSLNPKQAFISATKVPVTVTHPPIKKQKSRPKENKDKRAPCYANKQPKTYATQNFAKTSSR